MHLVLVIVAQLRFVFPELLELRHLGLDERLVLIKLGLCGSQNLIHCVDSVLLKLKVVLQCLHPRTCLRFEFC